MMKAITVTGTAPDPADPKACFEMLAGMFGDEWAYHFMRSIRLDRPGKNGLTMTTQISHELSQRLLAKVRADNPALDYGEAKLELAKQLGVTFANRPNFYKILEGKARPVRYRP